MSISFVLQNSFLRFTLSIELIEWSILKSQSDSYPSINKCAFEAINLVSADFPSVMSLFQALATDKHRIVYFLVIVGILIFGSAAITVLQADAHQKDQSQKIPKQNISKDVNVIFCVNHSSLPLVLLQAKTRLYNGNLASFETSFLRD
jgi:uncharacterized membrane protein YidH (DUF202 family)